MSHISAEYVKSTKEVEFEDASERIVKCIYELHDGTYICIESHYSPHKPEKEEGSISVYKWKEMDSCKSFSCDKEGNPTKPKVDVQEMLGSLEERLKNY